MLSFVNSRFCALNRSCIIYIVCFFPVFSGKFFLGQNYGQSGNFSQDRTIRKRICIDIKIIKIIRWPFSDICGQLKGHPRWNCRNVSKLCRLSQKGIFCEISLASIWRIQEHREATQGALGRTAEAERDGLQNHPSI